MYGGPRRLLGDIIAEKQAQNQLSRNKFTMQYGNIDFLFVYIVCSR